MGKKINRKTKETAMEKLGKAIKNERKLRRLNQTELANLSGTSINFIGQIEAGKPTAQIGKVIEVVQVLGLQLQLKKGNEILPLVEEKSI